MSGRFAPGSHLTIRDLAAWLQVSPMPVREALRRLTSEGALEPLPSGATRIPLLDLSRLQELTEIRLALEGLAARRCAGLRTDAELQEIQSINAQMISAIRAKNISAETLLNEQFHFAVYRAARADNLLRMIEGLWLQIGPYIGKLLREDNQNDMRAVNAAGKSHSALIDALRRKDPDAAERALRADLAQGAVILSAQAAKLLAAGQEPSTKKRAGKS